jgi:hypothetical protein
MLKNNPIEQMNFIKQNQKKILIYSSQLFILFVSIMFIGIGDHNNDDTLITFGVLGLIITICWFGTYTLNLIFCPDKDLCADTTTW